jgi:Immunity protein 8
MITARVKGIYTNEMNSLETYVPEDPTNAGIWIRALVGPRDDVGEESFDICVCTPLWLLAQCERDGFVLGRHRLIVSSYVPDRVRKTLTNLIEECGGESWQEVAEKVARVGHWEFENYLPRR